MSTQIQAAFTVYPIPKRVTFFFFNVWTGEMVEITLPAAHSHQQPASLTA